MTWEGRNLKMVVSSAGSIFAYTYNDRDLRLSKLAYSYIYYYTWDGDTLVSQRWGNNLFVFLYDENGSPIGLKYRTSDMDEADFYTYFFEKNLQGDIIGLYDMDGYCVATYTYDAWGRCTSSMTGEGIYPCDDTVVQYNPFRYRGYYYDTETGLYYLQSRYYDPNTGRFLNADSYVNANGDLLGFNMYAYCSNNPVMYTDPTGESVLAICLFLVASALIGATITGINSYNEGERGWELIGDIAFGFSAGLAVGGAIVTLGAVTVGASAIAAGAASLQTVTMVGVPVFQAFAIGALAVNSFAYITVPLLGGEMDGIEFEPSSPSVPLPQPSVPHPSY